MVEKIILVLSLLGLNKTVLNDNISTLKTSSPNVGISGEVYTQCNYRRSKITTNIIEISRDFEFGYLGEEETQEVNFYYNLKSRYYCYYCYFVYTAIDGTEKGYKETYNKNNSGEKIGTLTIKRSELPIDIVTFKFYLAAFNNYDDMFKTTLSPINHVEMNFQLSNRGGLSQAARSTTARSLYYFHYIKDEERYCRYYDEITLDSYPNINKHEIYFRLKPEDFIFRTINVFNSTEARLYILNNNGSFNDSTDYDLYGRYFPMTINSLGNNKYNLSYKNIRNGGQNNLYLNPYTMHMYKEKRNNLYEVKNIYLPLKKEEIYSTLKVMPVFINYGSNLAKVGIPFTIQFEENYVKNYYFTSERVDETGNDSSSEEIIP